MDKHRVASQTDMKGVRLHLRPTCSTPCGGEWERAIRSAQKILTGMQDSDYRNKRNCISIWSRLTDSEPLSRYLLAV